MQIILSLTFIASALCAMSPSPKPSSSPSYVAVIPLATAVGSVNFAAQACQLSAVVNPTKCCSVRYLPHGSVSMARNNCGTTIVENQEECATFADAQAKSDYAASQLVKYKGYLNDSKKDRLIILCGDRKYNFQPVPVKKL